MDFFQKLGLLSRKQGIHFVPTSLVVSEMFRKFRLKKNPNTQKKNFELGLVLITETQGLPQPFLPCGRQSVSPSLDLHFRRKKKKSSNLGLEFLFLAQGRNVGTSANI